MSPLIFKNSPFIYSGGGAPVRLACVFLPSVDPFTLLPCHPSLSPGCSDEPAPQNGQVCVLHESGNSPGHDQSSAMEQSKNFDGAA